MQDKLSELSDLYSLTEDNFEKYYERALFILTSNKRRSKDKTLVIVGGQSGAGKSRLVQIAKKDLENNAIIVDFDELRSLHPNYREVCQNYPEITHRILHPDTEKVKNKILKELIEKEYNVIYEGALRNTEGFLNFAKDFNENNYHIKMNIMAVPKLESFGSTFVRYATALLTDSNPRWVEKSAHDGSYEGVTRTVKAFIDNKLSNDINVFVRSDDEPKKIYSTEKRQHKDALTAIEYGREIGRKKAVDNFKIKFETVKTILNDKEPELLDKLEDWEQLYSEEVEYFNLLNKGSEYND